MKKNVVIVSVAIIAIVILLPKTLIGQRSRLLYESAYTRTGVYWCEGENKNRAISLAQVFYAKIYEDYLIETSSDPYNPVPYDTKLRYVGKNRQNCRIYESNGKTYIVDRNYNLTMVLESYDFKFGWGNVRKDIYYEVVKGDYSDEIFREMRQNMNWNYYGY